MPKSNHKYRVNVYLGKEMYDDISYVASVLEIPISTATKIILSTGLEVTKLLDNTPSVSGVFHFDETEVIEDGKQ